MAMKRSAGETTSALQARLAARGISMPSKKSENNVKKTEELPKEITQEQFIDEFGEDLPLGWQKNFSKVHDTWFYWDQLTDRVSWLPPNHEYHEAQLTRKETEMNKPVVTGINLSKINKSTKTVGSSGSGKKVLPKAPPKPERRVGENGQLLHPNNRL